jgi:predicted transcriptional regulator
VSRYRDPDLVRSLLESGYSEREIAERAGVTPEAVRELVNGGGARSSGQPGASHSRCPSDKSFSR